MMRTMMYTSEVRARLVCVWSATGDPARPLECRWVEERVTVRRRCA